MSTIIRQDENTTYLTVNTMQVSIKQKKSSEQICLKRIDEPTSCLHLKSRRDIIDTIELLKETLKEIGYEEIT